MDTSRHFRLRGFEAFEIIKHDQPFHPQFMRDEACHIADADEFVRPAVIFAHLTRHDDAPVVLHVEDRRIKHTASDIVEINIDAIRAGCFDCCSHILGVAIVDRRVKAQRLHIVAFVLRACDADNAAALHLGNLTRRRADRSCC